MKQAYLILDKQPKSLVNAEDVNHSDYGKIFQCLECGATVTLRSGYYKGEVWISPAFVHPADSPLDCKLRIDFDIKPKSQNEIFDFLKQGQSSQKLEKAFMYFLKQCLSNNKLGLTVPYFILHSESNGLHIGSEEELKRYIQYNKFTNPVHHKPDLFVDACVSLLGCKYNQKYFFDAIKSFQDNLLKDQKDLESYLNQTPKKKLSPEQLAVEHCRSLEGIIRFLCLGSSDYLRKEFLELAIFADRINLFADPTYIYRETKAGFFGLGPIPKHKEADSLRRKRVAFIRDFDHRLLKRVQEDPEYVKEAFQNFYQDIKEPVTDLIEFVLTKTFLSIRKYDWQTLPALPT